MLHAITERPWIFLFSFLDAVANAEISASPISSIKSMYVNEVLLPMFAHIVENACI